MKFNRLISTSIIAAVCFVTFICSAFEPTHTVPVIYINTIDATPIVDKITPIEAKLYITVPKKSKYEALGSPSEGISLTIRGRGNASFVNSPKKPYKLKFDSKTEILGLPKSKHFALLHHNSGYADYIASMAGMELGRLFGDSWEPHQIPVEIVLNDSYEGLYFLAETVKIDKSRLDIYEQNDLNTDPELIPYGWLVEVDNYNDDSQIILPETPNMNVRITYDTPKDLSFEQYTWLTNEFTEIIKSLYEPDESSGKWTDKIDLQSAARYFIIREIMHDTDAYNGSFKMYRDKTDNAKWNFGPLWDVTLTPNKSDWIYYQHPSYTQAHFIGPMMESPEFMKAVAEEWAKFYPRAIDAILTYIDEIATTCKEADKNNKLRWPDISNDDTMSKASYVKRNIVNSSKWIDEALAKADISAPAEDYEDLNATPEYYDLRGIKVANPTNGIYIMRRGTKTQLVNL